MPIRFHSAPTSDLAAEALYRILWLRSAVFVVEQEAAYDDIDGRDLEPGTVQFWAEEEGEVLSTLRVLVDPEGMRIGRVATAASARGRGLSGRLMTDAIARCEGRSIRLDAQAHLEGWYGAFGFRTCGPGFEEDGIPHVPMRRPA
ncbi:GNAT family N-acetyltransferase [Salinibacterium sp. SYSU T00001]|uniref:GNAT family N-acetyltransferase n=1 Tax=Homoserinimonas sedimenticola TaxID=2986805 RepID=UPI002235ED98|nr:GNAT family N-acetyltransferase [Salinibacterium sedimenticola]MCW4385423.1 GNAT family N-acetyltransferase [Salinibacterium sedimenticola]